jgi:hypothetical protein
MSVGEKIDPLVPLPRISPVRLLRPGRYGELQSPNRHTSPMTHLRVRLSAGERWRYEPPRELRRFVDCPAFGIAGRGKCAGAVEVPIGGARQGTCERFGRDVEGHSLQGQSTLEHDSFADAICRHYVTAQTHLIAILSTTTRPRSR